MSTVTLSKPHCAITSAENPEGIASQALTTALPEAQTFFTLFAIARVSLFVVLSSVEFPQMADRLADGLLYAHLAHADFARGVHYRRPGIIRQGYTVLGALSAHFPLGIAGDQHAIDAGDRLGRSDKIGIAPDFAVEEIGLSAHP